MCACTCVHCQTCMCACVHACVHHQTCVCACMCAPPNLYLCACVCAPPNLYLCVHACLHSQTCVCMCVHACTCVLYSLSKHGLWLIQTPGVLVCCILWNIVVLLIQEQLDQLNGTVYTSCSSMVSNKYIGFT